MAFPFPLTEEQQSIRSSMSGPSPVMVRAYAGTAKTTTILASAPEIRVPALALAFNRKIAEDLRGKMPQNWRVMTLNGLGQLAWARALPAMISIEVDERKLGKLVSQVAKDQKVDLSSDQWGQVRGLVLKAQLAGLSPGDEGQPFVSDSPESWQDLATEAWISSDDQSLLIDLAREVLIESIALARLGKISFDDQIYCPTILGGKWPLFPAAAGDETQDWSPLNQRMFQLATRPEAKIVLVGDPKQAIYGWRGADSTAMNSLRGLRSDWEDRRLTLTFRCPRRIVARQQHHAPGFQAAASCREGRFEQFSAPYGRDPLEPISGWRWKDLRNIGAGEIAILCRNNAPLLSLAFKLIRQQIAPVMLGRDIGKGLIALSRKIAKGDEVPIVQVLVRLEEWEASEMSEALVLGEGGGGGRADSIRDRAECLRAVIDGSQARTAGDLRQAISLLFSKDSGDLVLSTIHRAKGLEWDIVMHLDPWRIPSRQAKAAARAGQEATLEQEWNLKYVCETRTRDVLVQGDLEDFR